MKDEATMTTDRPMGIEVTQADRDAAAEFIRGKHIPRWENALSEAFSRYRQSSIASLTGDVGMRALVEEFCLAMEYAAGCDEGVDEDTAASEIMSWAGAPMSVAYTKARAALTPSPLTDAPDAVREALEKCIALIDDMSRFVGQMSLRDYQLFNEAPLAARKALKSLTTPPAKGDAGRLREAGSGDARDGQPLLKPGLSEADEYLEIQRMAYKTGYNEGYSDASDGLTDGDAAEEGWGQYLEKIEAVTEAEHLSPLDAARRAALSPQSDEGDKQGSLPNGQS